MKPNSSKKPNSTMKLNSAKILEVYNFMQDYEEKNRCKPCDKDLVEAGLVSSTSVVRYYYDRMEFFGMIYRPQVMSGGKLITPCRSIILLPLKDAHPAIQNLLKEVQNVKV